MASILSTVQVDSLLIDAFRETDEESIAANAVLCTFDRPRYVGVRRTESADRFGPAAVVDQDARYSTAPFPERILPLERSRRLSFSYSEPWTVPPWTLYILAPPPGFYASPLRVQLLDRSEEITVRPAGDNGCLYYFALVQGSGDRVAFETQALFSHDPRAAKRALERAEHVNAMRWKRLWETVAEPLATAGQVASIAAVIKTLLG